MATPREPILGRMSGICQELIGADRALRNEVNVPDTALPLLSLIDGDERTPEEGDNVSRHPAKPRIVTMTPAIAILLKTDTDRVGTYLNGWLGRIQKAVLFDDELTRLITTNGGIEYRGIFNNFAAGRSALGYTAVLFAIRYPFIPARQLFEQS